MTEIRPFEPDEVVGKFYKHNDQHEKIKVVAWLPIQEWAAKHQPQDAEAFEGIDMIVLLTKSKDDKDGLFIRPSRLFNCVTRTRITDE